ncbi:uncharacterized protein LOC114516362 isoform X2 [Dendronephthya gigantea]|uniref:uncharacterized protein LOC114516362 isoform X2 n=1 Tax=Dendronephthya gigantea TaxID=151771 RepID=UPI00106C5EFE|nr:uncharacterized protein LOC114516362 isoform X2 [Dendronephthya gigantea]
MNTLIGVITLFFLSVYGAEGLSCQCREEMCDTLDILKQKCKGGLVSDACHCCKTCAKLEGERCGGMFNLHGRCDQGLICQYSSWIFYHRNGFCRLRNQVVRTETPPTKATVLPRKWHKILIKTVENTKLSFGSGDDDQESAVKARTPNTETYFEEGTSPVQTEQPSKTDLYLEEELRTTQLPDHETEQPTEVIDLFSGDTDDDDDDSKTTTQATQKPTEITELSYEELKTTSTTRQPHSETTTAENKLTRKWHKTLIKTAENTEFSSGSGDDDQESAVNARTPNTETYFEEGTSQVQTEQPTKTDLYLEEELRTTQLPDHETEQPTEVIDLFSGDADDDDDDSKTTTQATQEPTEITELSYEELKTTSTTRQPHSETTTAENKDIQIIF